MEDLKLENCPFCDGLAVLHTKVKKRYHTDGKTCNQADRYKIVCSHCGCGTGWRCYIDDAAAAWNKRIITSPPKHYEHSDIKKMGCKDADHLYQLLIPHVGHLMTEEALTFMVDNLMEAGVRPVVRCSDCEYLGIRGLGYGYCKNNMCGIVKPDDYCSDGERRSKRPKEGDH